MARVRELGVWLAGERVATLRSPRVGRVTCEYADEIVRRHPPGTPLLSCSLPVRSGHHDARAFTTGLLPEGRHRQAMAALAGVLTHDLLGMLARFGRDVAGALVIAAEEPSERPPPAAPAYEAGELDAAVAALDDRPLGLDERSELSIAGLQDKLLLVELPGGGWGRPEHGYPSTHLLKVDDPVHRGLVRAEHACLELARAAGLRAASSSLVAVGDADCLIVRRFDREPGPDGTTQRVHQEDACQALGVDPEAAMRRAKYEAFGGPSLRQVAGLLETWSADPEAALLDLLDRMVFTVVIGDADAHGKNLALLHPAADRVELAPMYDTVPTLLWPALRPEAAMRVGGLMDLRGIGVEDIRREARSWGLSSAVVAARLERTLGRLEDALVEGAVEVDSPALGLAEGRVRGLLAG